MRYYHRLSVLSVLAASPPADLVTPLALLWDDIRLKHTWSAVPANWESLGLPPASLHIALKAHPENALVDALHEVSDPWHPKYVLPTTLPLAPELMCALLRFGYGAHLSKEQVAPHPETLGLVNSWLKHRGVPSSISVTPRGGWLTITDVPVSQADNLLGASPRLYWHTGTNETILRTVGYALPALLHTRKPSRR